jgi:hypothetical protein
MRKLLSAAQPQPKDRSEINAFVPSCALCRAALKMATSSPWGEREMRVGSADEQFEAKSLEPHADLRLLRRFYSSNPALSTGNDRHNLKSVARRQHSLCELGRCYRFAVVFDHHAANRKFLKDQKLFQRTRKLDGNFTSVGYDNLFVHGENAGA